MGEVCDNLAEGLGQAGGVDPGQQASLGAEGLGGQVAGLDRHGLLDLSHLQ